MIPDGNRSIPVVARQDIRALYECTSNEISLCVRTGGVSGQRSRRSETVCSSCSGRGRGCRARIFWARQRRISSNIQPSTMGARTLLLLAYVLAVCAYALAAGNGNNNGLNNIGT